MKREAELKSGLMKVLKVELPDFVHLRHEDVRSSGHPDISTTGWGRTTWIEVKHGTPYWESKGIQELIMTRLARAGMAWYLVYLEDRDERNKRTVIMAPGGLELAAETGFDHRFVAGYIRRSHGTGKRDTT